MAPEVEESVATADTFEAMLGLRHLGQFVQRLNLGQRQYAVRLTAQAFDDALRSLGLDGYRCEYGEDQLAHRITSRLDVETLRNRDEPHALLFERADDDPGTLHRGR